MAMDPVCKMKVDEKTATLKSDYEGKTYYFCNQSCKTKFDKNPHKIHWKLWRKNRAQLLLRTLLNGYLASVTLFPHFRSRFSEHLV